jgi:flagellar motility protein MotE (MotC chaperone)
MARVVVVGGGFGGMAVAVRLAKLGHEVTLLERAERLGGALTTVRADGFTWDAGPTHTMLPAVLRDLFRKSGRPIERELDLVPLDCIREHRFADGSSVVIEDVAMEPSRTREWRLSKVYVRRLPQTKIGRLRRRGEAFVVGIDQLDDLGIVEQRQGAANLLAAFEELKAADLAEVIHELAPKRRLEVASALDDERLADVLEELPEDAQVEILTELASDRAADVLEAMQPDDAVDLLSELPIEQREVLLGLMDPGEAADVRRLLTYGDDTAGGLMTSEPVVLSPDAAIAEALAHVRRAELSPALAAAVFVCRPPLETPSGKYLGMAHIQRMLREPPHESVGTVMDRDVEPLPTSATLEQVARHLATYNLVSVPITDELGRLVGAVTVDDVLDHLLPDDWRDNDDGLGDVTGEIPRVR